MSQKPVFVATHPRACSTAFERVFMTRRDILKTVHEPFGDAWYYGPERLAERYADDESGREASGFAKSTYQIIMERINKDNTEGKRLFIKDMAQYFFPQTHQSPAIAPSLLETKRGVGTESKVNGDVEYQSIDGGVNGHVNGHTNGETNGHVNGEVNGHLLNGDAKSAFSERKPSFVDPASFKTKANYERVRSLSDPASPASPYGTFTEHDNPTVVPTALLKQFHYAFLIRHPRYSIPSYYRCCIPPLDDMTGFHKFRPDEAGYVELRRFFDYCRLAGHVGPGIAGDSRKSSIVGNVNSDAAPSKGVDICLIDADDLLNNPEQLMPAFCKSVGVDWRPEMLTWDNEEDQEFAVEAFEKWKGFHEDAINSNDLHGRVNHRIKTDEELYEDWVTKYGTEGADVIKQTVADNVEHYEYLKRFAMKV